MRSTEDVCVLRTGRLIDADLASAALEEDGLPYYRRLEGPDGVEVAMPAAPTPGPGVWFTIWVPRTEEKLARDILSSLPIDLDADGDMWHYSPTERGRTMFTLWAIFLLLFFAFLLLQNLAFLFPR